MVAAVCPRCAGVVALHEGRPFVSARGVELWHPRCWETRHVRADEPVVVVVVASRPRLRPVRTAAVGLAALALLALGHRAWPDARPPAASLASIELDDREPSPALGHHTAREVIPPARPHVDSVLELRYPVPAWAGTRLDQDYPSLHDWIHPVTRTSELMPEQPSRHFGAERQGVERPECGSGHCGIDLDGPRGRPIVSVADGVVVRVERHELGLDGRSGRYVRIEHDDGTLTAYMHLDDVADGLEVGDHVRGGEYLGTLGASAVFAAGPHLHFSLEVPNHAGRHGDHTDTHYVDPAPYLVRATIVAAPDRRRAAKPAM
jgi:murein DD-endopeptidase MepM/ murein hydrolase activator NlpD